MKPNFGKFKLFRKLDKLEVYLIAADNPVGKKQWRPIFRRKRSREVLTREQVTAIKRGRKVLRREMKEQGLKRRIDFEVTATNLGLYFDRNRLFWPFFLWLIRDNTVAKVLATTAVLTTAITVTEPVIEYVIQYITQYVTQYITQFIDREVNRFTVDLDEELFNKGFVLSETISFDSPSSQLVCTPSEGVPCISIADIPLNVNDGEGKYPDNSFFAYSFYCRYESTTTDPADYHWTLNIHRETEFEVEVEDKTTGTVTTEKHRTSDAIWVMIFEDNKMIFCAKPKTDDQGQMIVDENGEYITEVLPGEQNEGYAYDGAPMIELAKNPEEQYVLLQDTDYADYYQIVPQNFLSGSLIATGEMENVVPFDETRFDPTQPFDPADPNGIHKYTVVIWLEGDDPECKNYMIGKQIGLNFRIQLEEDLLNQPSDPTVETAAPDNAG